jgi:hypothetical protein
MTKQEVSKYLADRNVVVGAEFEVICPSYKELADKAYRSQAFLMDMNFEYEIYMNRLMEYFDGDRYTMPSVPKWARKMGYKPGDEIPDPMLLKKSNRNSKKVLSDMVENYFRIDLLPIKEYVISSSVETKNLNKWVIKPDYSLPFHGFELVSPPMPVRRFVDLLPVIFKHIDKYSATNSQCGFHVSLSLKNSHNMKQDLDIRKLLSEVDEGLIYDYFSARRRCEYASPVKYKLRYRNISINDFQHCSAVNLDHLNSRNNKYVEFRHLGGRGYHTKLTVIKKIIAMYVKAMKRACGKERIQYK